MHILGTAIFFSIIAGPKAILLAPFLSLFGFFLIIPELLGLKAITFFYNPHGKQSRMTTLMHGTFWSIVGGVVATLIIPKEENQEFIIWLAGFLSGCGAAAFAFFCIHQIKTKKYAKDQR